MTSALDVAKRAVALWRQVHGNESLYLQCQRFDGYYWQWAYQGNEAGIVTYATAQAAMQASAIYTRSVNDPAIQVGDLLWWDWGSQDHVATVIGREGGRTIVTHTGSKGSNFLDLGNHVFVAHADTIPFAFIGASRTNGRNRQRTGLTAYGQALDPQQRRAIATARRRADATSKSEHVGGGATDILKGDVGNFVGWKRGENVEGNDVWFKGTSGAWFWSGGFEGGANTAGLPDLNTPSVGTRERRATVAVVGRALPTTKSHVIDPTPALDKGAVGTFDGWTNGEEVDGDDRWLHGAFSDRWIALRYLEPQNTDGLPLLPTPSKPADPPPTKPQLDPAAPWKNQTPDSALATWVGSPNYGYRASKPKKAIVLHWMAGTLAGTDAEFQKPGEITPAGRGTNPSTNYGVGLEEIHQYVKEDQYVHSNGDAEANATTITIEHEGGYVVGGATIPVATKTLDLGAKLMADIAKRNGFGRLEWMVNVFPHNHYVATQCPGSLNYEYEIAQANLILDPPKPTPDPEPEPEPEPVPEQVSVGREWLLEVRDDLNVILGED